MVEEAMITDEMRAKIGTLFQEPTIYEVERGAIRRFVEAVGDPNPLYTDDEYARKTRYGGIICPLGFFGWPTGQMAGTIEPVIEMIGAPLENAVNGGTEGEFFFPVRPGDVLVSYMRLANLYERSGRMGRMLFAVLETTFKNQRDQVVATIRHTLIFY